MLSVTLISCSNKHSKTCVIDLADKFVSRNNYDNFYVSSAVGAHLSKSGNKVVAEALAEVISI